MFDTVKGRYDYDYDYDKWDVDRNGITDKS